MRSAAAIQQVLFYNIGLCANRELFKLTQPYTQRIVSDNLVCPWRMARKLRPHLRDLFKVSAFGVIRNDYLYFPLTIQASGYFLFSALLFREKIFLEFPVVISLNLIGLNGDTRERQ